MKWNNKYNWISLILAILAIIWAIYTHYDSQKKMEPLYTVSKEASLIFNKESTSSKIKLIYNDTSFVDKNVYVKNYMFWNKGAISLDREKVRLPFTLTVKDSAKILDYKIVRVLDNSVNNFKLTQISNKELKIDWNYFDSGDAFEIQIIYAGYSDTSFNIQGRILSTKIKPAEIRKTRKVVKKDLVITLSLSSISLVLMIAYMWLTHVKAQIVSNEEVKSKPKSVIIISIFTIILFTLLIIFSNNWFYDSVPF